MRIRRLGAVLGAVAALACAFPAHADYSGQDASHNVQTFGSKIVNGVHYPLHLFCVWFSSQCVPANGDASGNLGVNVQSSALPSGAATSANQTTANTKLDQVHTDLTTGVTVGSSALPSGAATAANQATANSSLSQLHTDLTTGVTIGSSALPSGAATAANQTTANSSLATIITNTTGASTASNQTAVQANAGADATKATAIQGITGGRAVSTTQAGVAWAASGVASLPCTLNTTTTVCGPFTPAAGRTFHVSHKPTGFTAACQIERKTDGTNWAIETVTASGSTTQMANWAFSSSSQAISEDFDESQASVPYQLDCTSVSAGSDAVTFSQ